MPEITHDISIPLTSIQHSHVSGFAGYFPANYWYPGDYLNGHHDFILDGKPQRFNSDDTE